MAAFFRYNYRMTTNDIINIIRNAHLNADCLAQIASAVECMRESVAPEADADRIFTHRVKVFCNGGGVEYIKCVSHQDAQVARSKRITKGGVKLALIGTSADMAELTKTFGD